MTASLVISAGDELAEPSAVVAVEAVAARRAERFIAREYTPNALLRSTRGRGFLAVFRSSLHRTLKQHQRKLRAYPKRGRARHEK